MSFPSCRYQSYSTVGPATSMLRKVKRSPGRLLGFGWMIGASVSQDACLLLLVLDSSWERECEKSGLLLNLIVKRNSCQVTGFWSNRRIFFRIDKKVSFKCRGPWLVWRLGIKWVRSQSNSPELHGEFLLKTVKKRIGRTLRIICRNSTILRIPH